MKYASQYQKVEQGFLHHAPRGMEVEGRVLNDYLKYPRWNALKHRGWRLWVILQEMVSQGLVEQTVSGRGHRRSKYRLI